MRLRTRFLILTMAAVVAVTTLMSAAVFVSYRQALDQQVQQRLTEERGVATIVIATSPHVSQLAALPIVLDTSNGGTIQMQGADAASMPSSVWNGVSGNGVTSKNLTLGGQNFTTNLWPTTSTVTLNDGTVATVVKMGILIPSDTTELGDLAVILGVGILLSALLALVVGRLVVERAIRPVRDLTDAVTALESADADERLVTPKARDEVAHLTDAFNHLLDGNASVMHDLQHAIEKQRRFIADASHELRTPLTTISSSLEIMHQFPAMDNAQRKDLVEQAFPETHRMARLIDDLLILASIDAGDQLRSDQIELDDLLERAVRRAHSVCAPRPVTLDATPLGQMTGDPGGVSRVLDVLIDNVANHTPLSTTLSVSASTDYTHVQFTIADDGPGIADSERQHIFESFTRTDPARHGRHLGLGLAVAAAIVHAHQGTITASDVDPHGLSVTISLPLEEPLAHPATGATSPTDDAAPTSET